MTTHLKYLRYVLLHKWYVFLACLYLRVPLHQAVLHDWSKFLPSEWFAYAIWFYHPDKQVWSDWYAAERKAAFNLAWRHHQRRQPHHWQYWLLTKDTGQTFPLEMPDRFVREMVADWMGAGRALGKPDTRAWYTKNNGNMNIHPSTRARIAELLCLTP
jgi:hypothetical protein